MSKYTTANPGRFAVLTIRNGKTSPSKPKKNQRWDPMRTKAASRSLWMKSSVWRVPVVPPERAETYRC